MTTTTNSGFNSYAGVNIRLADAFADTNAIFELNYRQNFSSPIWNHIFPGLSSQRTERLDYRRFQRFVLEHIKYSILGARSFYLVAEVLNKSTSQQEILGYACFEWITQHHRDKKVTRYQLAKERASKVLSTFRCNVLDSHLVPEQTEKTGEFAKYDRYNPGVDNVRLNLNGVYIDELSTINDYFITRGNTHAFRPKFCDLPPLSEGRLSDFTKHYNALQEKTIDLVLGPQKPKFATFTDRMVGGKTYRDLWHCHNLTVSPSEAIPPEVKKAIVRNLLAWMVDAVAPQLYNHASRIPPGPDPICFPPSISSWECLKPHTEIPGDHKSLGSLSIPIAPTHALQNVGGVLSGLKQKLGGKKGQEAEKEEEKEAVVLYHVVLITPKGRPRKGPAVDLLYQAPNRKEK